MLALQFRFPAGRYHATPWGRHVNEGEVAWPPDPWRILRALIATWHHKVKPLKRSNEVTLVGLIESLASQSPEYGVPPASHSHTRHYLPQSKPGSTSLVFDAFAAVDRDAPLSVIWPDVTLPEDQCSLLDDLLDNLGYLGRAESWVEAKRVDAEPEVNCQPGENPMDPATGELLGEVVHLHSPVTQQEYTQRRTPFLADKKQAKKLAKTLPENLLGALSLDSADLQKQGWSQPPASTQVSYLRPVNALRPQRRRSTLKVPRATTASFLLIGKPLPRVEDSLRIGELVRMALMSQSGKRLGKDRVPPVFSGHDLPDTHRHEHAFYLPYDSDGDGYLDRVMVHVPAGFEGQAYRAIGDLKKIWQRDGGKWRLVLEGIGGRDVMPALTESATEWQSVTPYLHPWFCKKHFSAEDQIRKECVLRGLPEIISLEHRDSIPVTQDRDSAVVQFHRFRSRRGLRQPDRKGSAWRIRFAEPVRGPLALGFACHFGLGLFKPVQPLA